LRSFIASEAARRQGNEAFLRFHDALEGAVHGHLLELGEESTLISVTQQAGLDAASPLTSSLTTQLSGMHESRIRTL